MNRKITFAQAVNEAIGQAMQRDRSVICFGLGADDPKGVFGTTLGLQKQFGPERVFDTPTSENGMTGIGVGAALNGIRPVMTHQRLDFFLLAMDQLVNNAAKWHYMFGGNGNVPITIRLILGRGWGQGPTHSQNLQSWFAHIPGLKVVAPASAADAKGLLLASIFDNNPVVFLEQRWLHNMEGEVPEQFYTTPLGEAQLLQSGADITIVSHSFMSVEAVRAANILKSHGIHCDVIDLRTLAPLDWNTISTSVQKTGRLMALDTSHSFCSYAAEIVARASEQHYTKFKAAPRRIALPDVPAPTSMALTKNFYPSAREICEAALQMVGKSVKIDAKLFETGSPHDVPGPWFKGPF
ncbi:MAG: alpha-ketoacid dehydrogenase subunit beta [Oligoflexia bacterium]|nr:alpha-ketoacid dehydrogenase subunit beta [Oligoflexia bacterium]